MKTFTIVQEYKPIRVIYLNSKGREIESFGVITSEVIYIGSDKFFRSYSDPSELVKMGKGMKSRIVGKIIYFEYLKLKGE